MPHYDLRSPTGFYELIDSLGEIEQRLRLEQEDRPLKRDRAPRVQLWTASDSASVVGPLLAQMDEDMRATGAMIQSLTGFAGFRRRFREPIDFPFGPYWSTFVSSGSSEPMPPEVGELRVLGADRVGSLGTDLEVVGALVPLIADFPVAICVLRNVLRRIPLRVSVSWERGNRKSIVSAAPGERPLDDDRPRARQSVRLPDGTEIVQELF